MRRPHNSNRSAAVSLLHHHHHGHDDARDRDAHEHGGPESPGMGGRFGFARYVVAGIVVLALILSACAVLVQPGEAVVITRFGDPVRVLDHPGLAWRLPPPIEDTVRVDLRLRTTSSGLQDVGTREGLRILVQAYAAWQVPADPDDVRRFLRALENQPNQAGEQLRSFIGASLQTTASSFALTDLVNTDPSKVQLAQFEQLLRQRLEAQVLDLYGIAIRQVGIERLTLPAGTLAATVDRMRAERETVAAQRAAQGALAAAEIRANAERDARITVADAQARAADIEAQSRLKAADIYGRAYASNPGLYTVLRSLDTLDTVMSDNTRLILRTDAAPFRVFVDGPDGPPAGLPSKLLPAPQQAPPAASPAARHSQ
jgi:modulator of FtsH protease HflC